jgi:DNA repair protein RadC
VGSVLAAPSTALARLIDDPGLVNRLIAAKAVVSDVMGEQIRRARFDISNRLVQLWVISLFKERRTERVHLALLGNNMQLLGEERLAEGNLQTVRINLRKLVARGIEVGASAVVLMHNHPSGDPQPSVADIDETRTIASLLKHLDLHLHDHLIVAADTIFSMRGAKLI